MITLFHGSYTTVEKPLISAGRRNLDFGRGFYLSRIQSQAERWALVTGSRKNDLGEGIVNKYYLDETIFESYKTLKFPIYDMSWLDFVIANRKGIEVAKEFDIIEGGVANDQVIDTVEDYENGRITAEQALSQLRYKQPNHQLCIKNQEIIDKHLHFIASYTIKDEIEE